MTGTTGNLDPIIQFVDALSIAMVPTIVAIFGAYLAPVLKRKFHVDVNAQAMASFDDSLDKMLIHGFEQVPAMLATHGYNNVAVKNSVIEHAIEVGSPKFVGTLKAVGLDPANPDDMQNLQEALERRYLTTAAQHVALKAVVEPPVPAPPPADVTIVVPQGPVGATGATGPAAPRA